MIERISNSNLCPIHVETVRNSDYYFVDFVLPQEVESPPWTQGIICVAAGSMLQVWVRIPIDGFVRTAIPKLTGLCRNTTFCNVDFWIMLKHLLSQFITRTETRHPPSSDIYLTNVICLLRKVLQLFRGKLNISSTAFFFPRQVGNYLKNMTPGFH